MFGKFMYSQESSGLIHLSILFVAVLGFAFLVPLSFSSGSLLTVSADHCVERECTHEREGGGGDILEPRSEQEPETGEVEGTKRNYDNEAGLSGWEISLHEFWSESDGFDTDPEATVTTQADDPDTEENEAGQYEFDDVPAGDYLVCEENKNGWTQTAPTSGEDTYECENGTTGHIVTVTEDGSIESGNDFMNREEPGGSIEGAKRDYDTEAGLPNWEITLHEFWSESDGFEETPTRTTTTREDDPDTEMNEAGTYSFEDVPFGDYLVCEEDPVNWTQMTPTSGENTYECANGTVGHIVTVSEEFSEVENRGFMNREDPDYGGGDECARYYEEGEYDYAEEQYNDGEEGGQYEEGSEYYPEPEGEVPEECEDWGEGDEPDGGSEGTPDSASAPGLPNTGDGTLSQ